MFAGRHLLGTISGQVPDVSGTLVVGDDTANSVQIDLGLHSADFGSELWNDLVRGHDLLGAATHPVARYVSRSVRIGGDEMDTDIVSFARREYNLLMGERTAEEIKIAVGSAYPTEDDKRTTTFRGRDLLTGLPRSVEVGSDQIREALEPSIVQIVDAIKETIEETPPELVADIMDQGIVLAGGGALLVGLDRRVAEATQMPVHIADDPLTCVVRGTGRVLEDLDTLERVLVSEQYTRAPR